MFLVALVRLAGAAGEHGGKEHGGKEHGGKEHGGKTAAVPSSEDIRAAMKNYVEAETGYMGGYFEVTDPDIKKVRRLSLIRVHERVGKTGDYYYSCADFKDAGSGEMLDLDLDVEDKDGTLSVVDVRIHKVEGQARYTYDEKDNRIPLPAAQ
jgi:hypothetical protein